MAVKTDTLMSMGEAARLFCLSERTLARLRKRDPSFPAAVRVPGVRRTLFGRHELLEYLQLLTYHAPGEAAQ